MHDHPFENIPYESPVQPVQLSLEDTVQFRCHPEIACFNQCCQHIDIQLMPYDILRLKKHFGMTSDEFLNQYTIPFEMDNQGMPGVKLKPVEDSTVCPFLCETGCSLYADRPTACRYYPLGLLSMRQQGAKGDEDSFFLVKEPHCLGHQESRHLTIEAYRQEQGVEFYDQINREWRQIVLKKRSAGPGIGKPTLRSYQLFFLGSYNIDNFRTFVESEGFSEVYDLDDETLQKLKIDDLALLKLAFQLLKQVLFGEMVIPIKTDALEKRAHRRRQIMQVDPDDPNADYRGPGMI